MLEAHVFPTEGIDLYSVNYPRPQRAGCHRREKVGLESCQMAVIIYIRKSTFLLCAALNNRSPSVSLYTQSMNLYHKLSSSALHSFVRLRPGAPFWKMNSFHNTVDYSIKLLSVSIVQINFFFSLSLSLFFPGSSALSTYIYTAAERKSNILG